MMSTLSLRRRVALWLCPDLALMTRIQSIPPYPGKVVPRWWHNAGLRVFLTSAYRRMTLDEARDLAIATFQDDVPSRSALQRYWAVLDAQRAKSIPETQPVTATPEAS